MLKTKTNWYTTHFFGCRCRGLGHQFRESWDVDTDTGAFGSPGVHNSDRKRGAVIHILAPAQSHLHTLHWHRMSLPSRTTCGGHLPKQIPARFSIWIRSTHAPVAGAEAAPARIGPRFLFASTVTKASRALKLGQSNHFVRQIRAQWLVWSDFEYAWLPPTEESSDVDCPVFFLIR